MNQRARRFWPQATLLLAVVTPVALAEAVWTYWVATVSAIMLGWWWTVRQHRPLLGPLGSRILVVSAFAFLIVEHFWLNAIPVIALAHFMILVCLSKLLQERSFRDDAQLLILSLLLLVVAAIVSANVLFPVVLLIYLTVGLDALIRLHLALEQTRIERLNRALEAPRTAPSGENGSSPPIRSLAGPILSLAAPALVIGAVVFLICPRVGSGMFGRLGPAGGGYLLTGFADGSGFAMIGPIQESERPAMRVQIEIDGHSAGPAIEAGQLPLYFRGTALDWYRRRWSGRGPAWVWQRSDKDYVRSRNYAAIRSTGFDESIPLFPPEKLGAVNAALVQHYWLEPNGSPFLFSCYPPIALESREIDQVMRWSDEQTIQIRTLPGKVLRYTISSPAEMSPAVIDLLTAERVDGTEPQVIEPLPPLPKADEIRELVRTRIGDVGPLTNPARRLEFARRLERFLRSPPFTYTLSPPPGGSFTEPIGAFLFGHHRGHCEYFASAMVIMCQLSGVPARLVNGYCGGEYNPVGDFIVVRQKDAHAWVEVFIPGQDWVRFDPTPPRAVAPSGGWVWLLMLRRYLDYFQFQWANLVVAYDTDSRSQLIGQFKAWLARPAQDETTIVGAVAAFVRELFGGRLELSWRDRLLYWVFALLVSALVVLVGYLLWVLVSWLLPRLVRVYSIRPGRASRAGQVEFYRRFCGRLEALGLRRQPGQTPAEFAAELAARFPLLAEGQQLVQAYYEISFGRRPLPTQRRLGIEQFLDRLGQTDQAHLQLPQP